jgi:hypothetical protein
MQLKMWILSGTAIALWLIPLAGLDKRVGWHKSIQGLSLCAAVACAVSAGNIARKLTKENEIEAIKTRAITADVVDEIAVNAYVSQQQRQQEAEAILNPVEHLERALALPDAEVERSEPVAQNQLAEPEQNGESERAERALQLKALGWGKAKIILEVWGVSKGLSARGMSADCIFDRINIIGQFALIWIDLSFVLLLASFSPAILLLLCLASTLDSNLVVERRDFIFEEIKQSLLDQHWSPQRQRCDFVPAPAN